MKQITINKTDIEKLIGYVNTLYDFVDTASMEYENAEIVADGYDNFVVPIIEAINKQ